MKAIRKLLSLGTAVALVAGLAVVSTGWGLDRQTTTRLSKGEAEVIPVRLEVDGRPIERSGGSSVSFAPVVKKVSPSVVKVYTTTKARSSWQSDTPEMDDPFFRRFFGPGSPRRGLQPVPSPRQQGIGSGVIVTQDGYILTNNHVVDNADEVKVALNDGREFNAKVVGKDPKTDVAVIKIKADDLPFVGLADSDQIEVGDVVLAIGNPFGIGQTVTTGIVSARGRGGIGLDYEDFIQTDAAINPGNSGGALVDAEGRLIGINTAIVSRSGGNQGIGFAIPTNLAQYVMESIVRDGKVTRGYMGVLIQDVTPALAKQFKLPDASGALVGDVTPKGPADRGGIESGDVVLEFNGKPVRDSRQLKLQVAQTRPGTEVPVRLRRDGENQTIEITLQELPGSEDLAGAESGSPEDTGTLNGVAVGNLDSRTRQQVQAPASLRGAVVTEVEPNSAAAEAGLRPGDVILEINRQPVKSAEDAVRLTSKAEDRTSLLRVWRDGNRRYVVVDESQGG